MFPFSISFYIFLPWYDRVPASAIHSWWDDMSPINPYSKMVHVDPLTEPEPGCKLREMLNDCEISQLR